MPRDKRPGDGKRVGDDKRVSDAKLAARTGRGVAEWFEILDAEGAVRLSHDQITGILVDVYEAPEWGAQTVAIRYAQEHGMPLPGEQPDGTFSVRVSRMIQGGQPALLDVTIARATALAASDPHTVHRQPERTTAEWTLPSGDELVAVVGRPVSDKCAVTLEETRIRLPESVAQQRRVLEKAILQVVADAG